MLPQLLLANLQKLLYYVRYRIKLSEIFHNTIKILIKFFIWKTVYFMSLICTIQRQFVTIL